MENEQLKAIKSKVANRKIAKSKGYKPGTTYGQLEAHKAENKRLRVESIKEMNHK